MQTGGVASKYDDYWAGQLPQIRAQVQAAASGGAAVVSVPDLNRLGARQSWHGTAEVLAQEMIGSSGAHATSLGKTVAAGGICRPWPGRAFRFTISAAGDMLTITATADYYHHEGSPGPGQAASPRQRDRRTGGNPVRPGLVLRPSRAAAAGQTSMSSTGSWISWPPGCTGHGACMSAPAVRAARRRACTSSTRTARTALTAAAGWCASVPTR